MIVKVRTISSIVTGAIAMQLLVISMIGRRGGGGGWSMVKHAEGVLGGPCAHLAVSPRLET